MTQKVDKITVWLHDSYTGSTDTTQVMHTNPSHNNSVTSKISKVCHICYIPLNLCWNVIYELPNNLKFD